MVRCDATGVARRRGAARRGPAWLGGAGERKPRAHSEGRCNYGDSERNYRVLSDEMNCISSAPLPFLLVRWPTFGQIINSLRLVKIVLGGYCFCVLFPRVDRAKPLIFAKCFHQ